MEGYAVGIGDMYSKLTLQRVENKLSGPQIVQLENYSELFVDKERTDQQKKDKPQNISSGTGKKILAKGDPRMGKSTLGRKIAYDWAKGVFTAVSVVFFVSMKLIRPGQTIENIIIDQTPVIEGLGMNERKLETILDVHGHACLIVLDGLDEHDLGSNEDIRKIIEGRKLLSCNIFLTSRPHSTEYVERYFPIVIRVDGFSQENAERFVLNVVKKSKNVIDLLYLYRNNFNFVLANSSCFCPMLLHFLCLLVNDGEIGVNETFIPLGEIYARLVRFLYRNYCVRTWEKCKFIGSVKRIGKLAWKMLKSGQGYARQDEIFKEVGHDAFDTGFLIGDKGFELSRHETADVLITFPHETLKEFLGSIGFLQMLDDGESIECLLANETERSILVESRLILQFCLWLLSDSCGKEYFVFKNRARIYDSLVSYFAEQINIVQLEWSDITQIFPILHVPLIHNEENMPLVEFIRKVLTECNAAKEFYFSSISFYPVDILKRLVPSFPPHDKDQESKCFQILENAVNHVPLRKILDSLEEEGIYFNLLLANGIQTDLTDCMHSSIRMLTLYDTTEHPSVLNVSKEMPMCPSLTQLALVNVVFNEGVLTTLDSAVDEGLLPSLSHLTFATCWFSLTGKLSKLFKSVWPTLTHLRLNGCILSKDDIETLTHCLSALEGRKLPHLTAMILDVVDMERKGSLTPALKTMFQEASQNIREFGIHHARNDDFQNIIAAVNQGKLPNLTHLLVSMEKDPIERPANTNISGRNVQSEFKVFSLTSLTMHRFIFSTPQLNAIAKSSNQSQVNYFDVSGSSGISGNLSLQLNYSFDSLKDLLLSNCGLDGDDLRNLAQANAEDRLHQLKFLDVSDNPKTVGKLHCLFSYGQKWEKLLILNITQVIDSTEDFRSLIGPVRSGALESLIHLGLSENSRCSLPSCINSKWIKLQALDIRCSCRNGPSDHVRILQHISGAVKTNKYPNLKQIRVSSIALPSCLDSESKINTLEDVEEASALRQYLQEVTNTSSSLLTSSESTNITHLINVHGLVTVKKILRETSTEEYSIIVRAVLKLAGLVFYSGTLPDFRTMRDVLYECIDNNPDQFKLHHPSLKALADAVCTYLHLFFTGQPRDSRQIVKALWDLINSYFNLCDLDRSALISVNNVFQLLFNSTQDDDDDDDYVDDDIDDDDDDVFESSFETLRSWVEKTDKLTETVRPHFKSAIDALLRSVRSHMRYQRLDLREVRTALYQSIDDESELPESEQRVYKYLCSSLCTGIECLVNRPVNLEPLSIELYKFIESYSEETLSDSWKSVLKFCVDVGCTLTECFFHKPINLDPVRDMLHDKVERHFDPSDTDYEAYKSLATDACKQLQTLATKKFGVFSMYSLQSRPRDKYELTNTCTSHYRQKIETDRNLRELKLLMYRLRKRGICVYMHYIPPQ